MKLNEITDKSREVGFGVNIETETLDNTDYRRVLFTSSNNQLVVMSLQPGQEIGMEIHNDTAQFIRIEGGTGKAIIGGQEYELADGVSVIVPKGAEHNVINTSDTEELKLYTVYSPGVHEEGTVEKTKQDEKIDEVYKRKDYVRCPDGQRHDWQWGGSLGAEAKTNRAVEGRKCGNCGLTKKVFGDTGKRINR